MGNSEQQWVAMIQLNYPPGTRLVLDHILHAPGFIDIDCGCGYDMPIKTLSCLCLENMLEFYI